ncbi:hypothetical protein [Chromobacterium sp.]|uniref:hypothetical protein n=1 Tax=Chromobacterium sp. TaxID=306190 RepID=UPI0035AE851F
MTSYCLVKSADSTALASITLTEVDSATPKAATGAPPSPAAALLLSGEASANVSGALCAPLVHALSPGRPAASGRCVCFALDDRAGVQAGESSGSASTKVMHQGWGGQRRTLHFYWG